MWLSRVCRECVWETNAPSTIWSPDASICVVMSAHSCMQKFLEYIAVCSCRLRYVDSSSPRSCMCPRWHLHFDKLSFSFMSVTRHVVRLCRCPSGRFENLHMSMMCLSSRGLCLRHCSGDSVQMSEVLAHSKSTF